MAESNEIDVNKVKKSIPEDLKLKGISALRPIIINKGLTIVNTMVPPLQKELTTKFLGEACPSPRELERLIVLRNNIVTQANSISTFLNTVTLSLGLASTLLSTILTVLTITKTTKTVAQAAAAFLPITPGAVPSTLGAIDDTITSVTLDTKGNSRLQPIKDAIDGLLVPISILSSAVALLVSALSNLDIAIAKCTINPSPNPEGDNVTSTKKVIKGPILKLKIQNSGRNYKDGTYTNIKLNGGDGSGATATIIVSGNKVIRALIENGGKDYTKSTFDPSLGFQEPKYLTVDKGVLGSSPLKFDTETVDLKNKIRKKLEKTQIVGDGLILTIEEIGVKDGREVDEVITSKPTTSSPLQVIDPITQTPIQLPPLIPLNPDLKEIAKVQQEASQTLNDTTYQGFIIEIEEVPFSPTVNRRRAVGLNSQGIKLIETELSFTTDRELLINELKLIIDRDNLKAY
jgi:hypothetical protein